MMPVDPARVEHLRRNGVDACLIGGLVLAA